MIADMRNRRVMVRGASWGRRGILLGIAAGVMLVVAVMVIAFTGDDPPGGTGERVMGMSILLTRVGGPLSYALVEAIDRFDSQVWLLDFALPLAILTVVVNAGLIGGGIGWVAFYVGNALRGRGEPRT